MSGPRVTVLGAGVVGAACARALADGGAEVRVLDPGSGRAAASWAAAGILSPSHPYELPETVHRLGDRGLELWEEIGARHPEIELRRTGAILIGDDPRWRAWRRERGLVSDPVTWTRAADGGEVAALRFAEVCLVRPPRLAPALLGDIVVERRPSPGLAALRAECDVVVVATGAWAGGQLAELGVAVEVAPRRGQMLLFGGGSLDTILMEEAVGGVAVPRLDGRIVAGTTVEETGFDAGTVAEDLDRLEAWARRWIPDLGPREDAWAGLRPWSADPAPTVGHIAPDVVVAVGHFRNGILLAPATGEVVADLILGRRSSVTADRVAAQPG